jgi:glyoxylase-like metal-dependent hydrolase (beta-lactamase superfamily II)
MFTSGIQRETHGQRVQKDVHYSRLRRGVDQYGTEEYKVQVFHTPGHSAGSVSLLVQEEGALFCGDAVLIEGDLPVYDDARQSVRSIIKLRSIRGIRVLLSAWDEPRENDAAYRQMDRALAYMRRIHESVITVSTDGTHDPMEIAKRTVALIGLPSQAVSPLLVRTFAANMRVRDQPDLAA